MTPVGAARRRSVTFSKGAGRVATGIADQVVMASANAANGLLAVALLPRQEAGKFMLALAVAYFVISCNRAFAGDVLLAHASRYDADERRGVVEHGIAAAAGVAVCAALLLTGLWALWPALSYLIWFVPFLPFILLHDTGRYAYLAARDPRRALIIDLTWVGVQAAGVVIGVLLGVRTGGMLFVCWGLGATAGSILFLIRAGLSPVRGRPLAWVRETRHLSGWFTGAALVAQVQSQFVAFLVVGILSEAAFAGLRLAQIGIVQPVQNLVLAMTSLMVPRASRLAAAGDRAALRRQTRSVTLASALIAIVVLATAVTLARPLLNWLLPEYLDVASIAFPVAVQAGLYLVVVPFTAALRGMHRARLVFAQYVVLAVACLVGLIIGAYAEGLQGTAWGLTAGAAVGTAFTVASYGYAVRRLTPPTPQP